ncbi:MAG: hypothetical protein SGJ27_20890 [Candidatus Melainabacteria bacterium]|nr:hypothetical protein [Candidatus Melainabacteria bacterium]
MLKSISIHYFQSFLALQLGLAALAADSSSAKASAHAGARSTKTNVVTSKQSTKDPLVLGDILELQQTHRLYGRLTVSIAKDAVFMTSRDKGFRFLCKAPNWDVVAFDDVRKISYVYPFRKWRKNGIRSALSIETNDAYKNWPMILDRKQKYAGLDAVTYVLPNQPGSEFKGTKFGEYMIHKRAGLNFNAIHFIEALYDLPPISGIPLRFTRAYGGHKWGFGLSYNKEAQRTSSWLSTSGSQIRKANPSLFAAPVGYKPASDSEVLMRSSDVVDTFGQILD